MLLSFLNIKVLSHTSNVAGHFIICRISACHVLFIKTRGRQHGHVFSLMQISEGFSHTARYKTVSRHHPSLLSMLYSLWNTKRVKRIPSARTLILLPVLQKRAWRERETALQNSLSSLCTKHTFSLEIFAMRHWRITYSRGQHWTTLVPLTARACHPV